MLKTMSQVMVTKTQEEYEDDFEKDLDWLISEDSQEREDHGPDYGDIEAKIDKELEVDEKGNKGIKQERINQDAKTKKETTSVNDDEERWPSPMEPLEYDSDRESPLKSPTLALPPLVLDDQPDEEKKYMLEKIQQANKELQDQEAPDMTRRRRLHFKEMLVDLVVPPSEHKQNGTPCNVGVEGQDGGRETDTETDAEVESDVSGKLSELKISPQKESRGEGGSKSGESDMTEFGKSIHDGQGGKEGRVLVEKDGKFDLVSLKEVESQGLLPPLAKNDSDNLRSSPRAQEATLNPTKIHTPSSSPFSSPSQLGIEYLRTPRPPAQPRSRPNSASHSQRGSQGRGSKRRVQSATGSPCQATYTLSPQQKEALQKTQEKRERLAREAEERKREEEEQKKQENETAFRAWLMRKREQVQVERRIHRAQEMEKMNTRREPSDPEEAFRLWLVRKQEQQHRERQLEELKRMEQEGGYLLHRREDCEQAFKSWLRRKRSEKRAEQQVAREHSRRLVLEERRARRMQDLMCSVNDTKPFRFSEQLAYRF